MMATLDGAPVELDDDLVNLTLYGFGIYSSFILSGGRLVRGWDYHVQRIISDTRGFLGLDLGRDEIEQSVRSFAGRSEASGDMTCRITVFPREFNLGAPQAASGARLLVTGRSGSSLSGKPLQLHLAECDRPFAQYKITNIAAAMKRRAEAKSAGHDDALFMAHGMIDEGPTWNVFFVRETGVVTPPLNGRVLPGVTRRIIMDILGDEASEEDVRLGDLDGFTGAFATNSAIGVVPIRGIGDIAYATDHEIIARLQRGYADYGKAPAFEC